MLPKDNSNSNFREFCETHPVVQWYQYVRDLLEERDKTQMEQSRAYDRAILQFDKTLDERLKGWPGQLTSVKEQVDRLAGTVVTEKYVNEKIGGVHKFAIATLVAAILALLSALTSVLLLFLQYAIK